MFKFRASSPQNKELVDHIVGELKGFDLWLAAIMVRAAKESKETQKLATSVESKLFLWFYRSNKMPDTIKVSGFDAFSRF